MPDSPLSSPLVPAEEQPDWRSKPGTPLPRRREGLRRWLARGTGLVLFIFLWDWPFSTDILHPEASWLEILNHGFSHRWQWGRELVFTHGPLGFIATGLYVPDTFALTLVLRGLLQVLGVAASCRVAFQIPSPAGTAMLLLALIANGCVAPAVGKDCLWLGEWWLAVCGYLLFDTGRRSLMLGLIAVGSVLSLVKFTFLPMQGAFAAALILQAWNRGDRRGASYATATAVVLPLLIWMLCGQALGNVPAYLQSSLEMSSAYSVAMSIPGPASEVRWAGAAAGCLVLLFILQLGEKENRQPRLLVAGLTILTGFLAWKQGFVRHDDHCLHYFAMLSVLSCVGWLSRSSSRWRRRAIACLSLASMGICLGAGMNRLAYFSHTALTPEVLAERAVQRVIQNVEIATHFKQRWAEVDAERRQAQSDIRIPDLSQRVGQAPLAWIGTNSALPVFNELSLFPRGTVVSYAPYTQRLANESAAWFRGPQAPPFVGVTLAVPDSRLLMGDDGRALLEVLLNYHPVENYGGTVLLQRTNSASAIPFDFERQVVLDRTVSWNDLVSLPDDSARWHAASIEIRLSCRGELQRTFSKVPPVIIALETEDHRIVKFRLIPDQCAAWFLIDPLVAHPSEFSKLCVGLLDQRTRGIHVEVAPQDAACFDPEIRVRLCALPAIPRKPDAELVRWCYPGLFAVPEEEQATLHEMRMYQGHPVYTLSAPGSALLRIPPGTRTIRGKFGQVYAPRAFSQFNSTDSESVKKQGVTFTVSHVSDSGQEALLDQRVLNPWLEPRDRAEQSFSVSVADFPPGRLKLTTFINHTWLEGPYFRDIVAE